MSTDKNQIIDRLYCKECLTSKGPEVSVEDPAALEVGWTERGLQIWCLRHNQNIADIDFQGQKVKADTRGRDMPDHLV